MEEDETKIVNIAEFPPFLAELLPNFTKNVRIEKSDAEVHLIPMDERGDIALWQTLPKEVVRNAIDSLRGSLKDYPDMSVDKFLERKRADKQLEFEIEERRNEERRIMREEREERERMEKKEYNK